MNVAILVLLELGITGREIARLLGLSEYQVSIERRRLGYGQHRKRPGIDWVAVRRYYEAGYSVADCKEHFGFSSGAWSSAVARGDVVPRRGARPRFAHERRTQVAALLEQGLSQAEIARRLGISPATVSYHSERLGRPVREDCARRYDWAEVQRYYDEGHSISACQVRFGFARKTVYDAVCRGALVTRPPRTPLEELCVSSTPRSRSHLRRRLIEDGVKEAACEACGIDQWRGVAVSFELHHRNGDPLDNRIENLQVLCPNCHSQTDSWGGRNRRAGLAAA